VVTITVSDQCVIEVSNAVTPNEDGDNDYFHIGGLACYSTNNTVEIYNRWGVLVFEASKYNNVDNVFNGNSNGKSIIKQSEGLAAGTYYYVIKYVDFSGKVLQKAGYLYLSK
jgi:gliding motility-associated-like protein